MKLKLRKIGNGYGVILPKNVITSYKEGAEIDINVITIDDNVITNDIKPAKKKASVITKAVLIWSVWVGDPVDVITDDIPIARPHKKPFLFNQSKGIWEH